MNTFADRIARIQKKIASEKIDVLLVAAIETPSTEAGNNNVRYATNFGGSTGLLAVGLTDAVLVVDGRYFERAKGQAHGVRVIQTSSANRGVVDFTNFVKPALQELKLGGAAQVGFEANRISVTMAEAWGTVASLVPTTFLIESLRQFKDDAEIELLKEACRITCDVWAECAPKVVAGRTEREVALDFDMAHRAHGAVGTSFGTIVASGLNAASPHHETSDRVLAAGDVVTVDFGGKYQSGYCSDLTRTIFVPGKDPDPKLVEIYKTVLGANQAARAALTAGMKWAEYDKVARDYIVERGFGEYFGHGLGHSLGLEAHDPFNYAEATFEPGLVITDEPGIYVPGLGGVRIEDDLVLTENGITNLTDAAPYLNS